MIENMLDMNKRPTSDMKIFSKSGRLLCNNEIRRPEFKTKRFYKYVDKMDKFLVNKLNKASNLDSFKATIYYIGVNTVIHRLIYDLKNSGLYNDNDLDDYEIDDGGLYHIIHESSYNTLFTNDNFKDVYNLTLSICREYVKNETFPDDFIKIGKWSFERAIVNMIEVTYITQKTLEDSDVILSNYTTRDIDDISANLLLEDYMTDFYHSVEFWIIEKIINNKAVITEKQFNDIKTNIDIVITENKKLKTEIKDLRAKEKNFLPTLLKYKKESEEGTKEQQNIYNEHLAEKNKEIKKLNKTIEELTDKLMNLSNDATIIDSYIEDNNYECDTTLPYVFVMTNWSNNFSNKLEEEFKNVTILYSSEKIPENTRLVIFITSHLKHNMYYKLKNTCINNNIPYIHCASTNIDIIKSEIAKQLT